MDEIGEVDDKTGDGVGKGNYKQSGDELRDGGLDVGDGLRINLHPEHNHKAVNNKGEDKGEISNVSEGAPDLHDWTQGLETKTGLGVSGLDEVNIFDVISDVGEVIAGGNGAEGGGGGENIAKRSEKLFWVSLANGAGVVIDTTKNSEDFRIDVKFDHIGEADPLVEITPAFA